jgi:hypothetical protein
MTENKPAKKTAPRKRAPAKKPEQPAAQVTIASGGTAADEALVQALRETIAGVDQGAKEWRNRELVVLIPSLGRPDAVKPMCEAWRATDAFAHARMLWVLHADDPALPDYQAKMVPADIHLIEPGHRGMGPAINAAGRALIEDETVFAIGVLNDDHLPRTEGWAETMLAELHKMGTGVVYGDDLMRGEKLSTAWFMTADIVRAVGRVVPSLVQHWYADNSIQDLANAAGILRYIPQVVIEHMHPKAGKAEWDATYEAGNSKAVRDADRKVYDRWRARPATSEKAGLAGQAEKVRALLS